MGESEPKADMVLADIDENFDDSEALILPVGLESRKTIFVNKRVHASCAKDPFDTNKLGINQVLSHDLLMLHEIFLCFVVQLPAVATGKKTHQRRFSQALQKMRS